MSSLNDVMNQTMAKMKELVDVNTVIGNPITTPDGVTIIPVSKVSVGFGGGGSDYAKSSKDAFGGGAGGGMSVTPICFLIVSNGNVRMMPVPVAANTTADRIVEMVPDTLDKIASFIDSRKQ